MSHLIWRWGNMFVGSLPKGGHSDTRNELLSLNRGKHCAVFGMMQNADMNASILDIREADHRDLPALIELYQHLVEGDEQPGLELAEHVFERFKAYKGSAIVVAETAGVLVASCTIVVVPNLTRGGTPYGLIENVVTHRDFRNRGFGKHVLLRAVDLAWKADCYKIMLMTGSKRHETLNFYLGAGFEQSKTGFQMRRIAVRSDN